VRDVEDAARRCGGEQEGKERAKERRGTERVRVKRRRTVQRGKKIEFLTLTVSKPTVGTLGR
jgi:hypothetical protein